MTADCVYFFSNGTVALACARTEGIGGGSIIVLTMRLTCLFVNFVLRGVMFLGGGRMGRGGDLADDICRRCRARLFILFEYVRCMAIRHFFISLLINPPFCFRFNTDAGFEIVDRSSERW